MGRKARQGGVRPPGYPAKNGSPPVAFEQPEGGGSLWSSVGRCLGKREIPHPDSEQGLRSVPLYT